MIFLIVPRNRYDANSLTDRVSCRVEEHRDLEHKFSFSHSSDLKGSWALSRDKAFAPGSSARVLGSVLTKIFKGFCAKLVERSP